MKHNALTIRIPKSMLILLLLGMFFVAILGVSKVFADTTSADQVAKKYGITFPVAELGGCTDVASCRTYCEDPVNKDACIQFAKSKGFYKDQAHAQKTTLLSQAKSELGCDSEDSCKAFCQQAENIDKCAAFAKAHSLQGGQTGDPEKADILAKAKEVLGCDSYAACKAYCQQTDNKQKCSAFAQQTGLHGGEKRVGPGGCTSGETCKVYCSDPANYQECAKSSAVSAQGTRSFKGPGGCDSEAACKAYCVDHPQECQHVAPSSENQNAKELYMKLCQANPDKCSGTKPSSYPSGYSATDASQRCAQYPGCSWVDNRCQCQKPSPSSSSTEGSGPAAKCAQYGCQWTGSACACQHPTQTQ